MKESRMLQFLLRESYMYLTKKNVPPKRVTCKAFHSIEPIFTFFFQPTTHYQSRIQDHSINSRSRNLQLIHSHQTHKQSTKFIKKKEHNSKQNHTFFFLFFFLYSINIKIQTLRFSEQPNKNTDKKKAKERKQNLQNPSTVEKV